MNLIYTKELSQQDIDVIVRLHNITLKESFLNNFGNNFLALMYKTIVSGDKNVVILIRDRNKVIGFLVATKDIREFYKFIIIKKCFSFLCIIVPKVCLNPSLLIKIIEWLLAPKNKHEYAAELQFIAVLPAYRRKGLGKKLINKLNNYFRKNNIERYRVGTKAKNKLSNNFYLKYGFALIYSTKVFNDLHNFYLSPPTKYKF